MNLLRAIAIAFPGFPLGVTSGTYDHDFDLTMVSSYNDPFVTANGGTTAGAEAALIAGLNAGGAYVNVHSNVFAGGEIRGFAAAAVPEPATMGLLTLGLACGALARRHRSVAD